MVTKRVYELEVDDVFRWNNNEFRVLRKNEVNIFFINARGYTQVFSFGAKNQMRVEWVAKMFKSGRPKHYNTQYGKVHIP